MAQSIFGNTNQQPAGPPAPRPPGTPGGPPGPPAPTGTNSNIPDPRRNNLLYPSSDPQQAMINAILDAGGNPYTTNPFMRMLLQTAPGLMQAVAMQNIGTTADQIAGRGGEGALYRDMLMGALGNNGGNAYQILGNQTSQFKGITDQLTQRQRDLAAGSGNILPGDVSPFAGVLEEMFSSPEGVSSLYSNAASPFLGSGLAQANRRGLNASLFGANRRLADDPQSKDIGAPTNFWDYIFPGGRGAGTRP